MRVPSVLAASSAALFTTAAAHGNGLPKIMGARAVAELKARNIFQPAAHSEHAHEAPVKRQGGIDGQCGSANGASCDAGYCCSSAGWCGQGTEYCASPDCQFQYGPACDANTVPSGDSTESVARTKVGSVPYGGAGIYDCTVAGTVALTYDDGPYIYTNDLLDILAQYNAKATLFITGNNNGKGEIDVSSNGWDTVIKRAYSEGHQIASHTWSHQNLDQITSDQRKDQMIRNEMALRNILGFFPTYMRPPYSACITDACESDMADLGYHVTYFDLDTDDYNQDSPSEIQNSKDWFSGNLTGSATTEEYLVIGHDIHEQTVHNLTAYMLQTLQERGFRAVTVGECLGDDAANWYRSSSGSTTPTTSTASATTTTAPTSTSTNVSQDGSCGGTASQTCLGSTFGNCCSQHGFCGASTDYCGDGCQSGFGTCGSSSGTTTAATSTSTTTSTPTNVSQDGQCGTTAGTCLGSSFGNCCSQYGWCGSTTDHCGTGCNASFGTCT